MCGRRVERGCNWAGGEQWNVWIWLRRGVELAAILLPGPDPMTQGNVDIHWSPGLAPALWKLGLILGKGDKSPLI